MNALVGYTGFVGSNIYAKGQLDAVYHSQNIEQAYGTRPDLLIYAGLRAEKYLANSAPEKDWELIVQAQENIAKIQPRKLVLISTIDVFHTPQNVDETSEIVTEGLLPYGFHRYQLEQWVREHYPDALIIRLPGLFGKNIKKNFIYDYINLIPFMIKEEKMAALCTQDVAIRSYYTLQDNGFYKVNELNPMEKEKLKVSFKKIGFSALHFTDSRSVYQFYHLENLWGDIQTALNAGLTIWHPATEPISAGELYYYLSGEEFVNELEGAPVNYDYHTVYGKVFGGDDRYIATKNVVLAQIKKFIEEEAGR